MDKFDYQVSLKKDRKGFIARYLAFERWFNRPLAAVIVRLVYPTGISPNLLTVIAFALAMVSAVLFGLGSRPSCLWAAVFMQMSLVFDCSDGMLARAKNQCSRYGAYFDLFLDRISDFACLLGAAVGHFRQTGSWPRLSLFLLTIALYMLQVNLFYVFNRYSDSKSGESGEARAVAIYFITFCAVVYRLEWIFYVLLAECIINLAYRFGHFLLLGLRSAKNSR